VTPDESRDLQPVEGVLGGDRRVLKPSSAQAVLARWKTWVRSRGAAARSSHSGSTAASEVETPEPHHWVTGDVRSRDSTLGSPSRKAQRVGGPPPTKSSMRVAPVTTRERAKNKARDCKGCSRVKLSRRKTATSRAAQGDAKSPRSRGTRLSPVMPGCVARASWGREGSDSARGHDAYQTVLTCKCHRLSDQDRKVNVLRTQLRVTSRSRRSSEA
jgi:hypothetical protein